MRVISLLPAATEVVAALELAESLVAVTHECDYPVDVVKHLPRVTGSSIPVGAPGHVNDVVRETSSRGESLFQLDADLIKKLQPDVILTQALCDVCAVSETDVRGIAASMDKPPTIVTLSGTTIEGVLRDITNVANALGAPEGGIEFVGTLRQRLNDVHSKIKQKSQAPVRTVVIEWTDPVFVAGHWVPEMVAIAGGLDVMAEAGQHSVIVDMKDIIAARPEVVFISPCGYDLARAAAEMNDLMDKPEWQWLRGVRVYPLDANGVVSRPGPRLVDGVEVMARHITRM